MCPICWISGFIAVLFGGSFVATVNHPISWIIGGFVVAYGLYKFYDGYKRIFRLEFMLFLVINTYCSGDE